MPASTFSKISGIVTFKFPYYVLHKLVSVIAGKRFKEIWNKLAFKNLHSLIMLPDGNKLVCPWRDSPFWIMSTIKEIYELQVYDWLFKPRKGFKVVDAGAHIGIYTLRTAKKVGDKGLIITIEPENRNYELLVKNVRINRYKNVVPIKLALSNFKGKTRFYIKDISLHHSLHPQIEWNQIIVGFIEVEVATLVELLKKLKISRVDLLKVDVEGAELEVLEGSEQLLKTGKVSKIVVAAYHTSSEARVIEKYLQRYRYKTHIIGLPDVASKQRICKYLYAMK